MTQTQDPTQQDIQTSSADAETPSTSADSTSNSVSPTSNRPQRPHEASIRETLESIVIAFVLAFVFRAFVVEAFVIPTGSMAPTLLGKHVQVTCPQCGYTFTLGPAQYGTGDERVDRFAQQQGARLEPKAIQSGLVMQCPMCEYTIREPRLSTRQGDRILVLKYIYALTEPKRWDVVVFKNPENPLDNYIKRLVGLPNEQLRIIRGDIYTRKTNKDLWVIQRKPDRIQRAVWQPVYHSRYTPRDGGKPSTQRQTEWKFPWRDSIAEKSGESSPFKYINEGQAIDFIPNADRPAFLDFNFSPEKLITFYAYNQFDNRVDNSRGAPGPYHDVRVAAAVKPLDKNLTTQFVIGTSYAFFRAIISPDGSAKLQRQPRAGVAFTKPIESKWQTVKSTDGAVVQSKGDPLPLNRGTAVEFWHVDQKLSLWIRDEKFLEWNYELQDLLDEARFADHALLQNRFKLHDSDFDTEMPALTIRIGLSGAPARLRNLELDRDLYYTFQNRGNEDGLGNGQNIARIGKDEFYCLGDNSPASKDSRMWTGVHSLVKGVVNPNRNKDNYIQPGLVPRELMIGKAFFVYFPAPHSISKDSWGVIPNFGKMRFIH